LDVSVPGVFGVSAEVIVDDLMYIGTEKSIESFKTFLVDLEKGFKMILT
jgi:hypothetical protein